LPPTFAGAVDGGSTDSASRSVISADASRAGDPSPRGGRALEREARGDALGHRADGEVSPVEHLPQDRRGQPYRGRPLGAGERPARLRHVAGPRRLNQIAARSAAYWLRERAGVVGSAVTASRTAASSVVSK